MTQKSALVFLIIASAIFVHTPVEGTVIDTTASTFVNPAFFPPSPPTIMVSGAVSGTILSLDAGHIGNTFFLNGAIVVWTTTVFCFNFPDFTLDACLAFLPATGVGQRLACRMPAFGTHNGVCDFAYKTLSQVTLPGAAPKQAGGFCSAIGCSYNPGICD